MAFKVLLRKLSKIAAFLLLVMLALPYQAPSAQGQSEFNPLLQGDACSQIVQTLLEATREVCDGTGRNSACYGNFPAEAQPRADVSGFEFDTVGDVVNIADMASIRLSALDLANAQWGVALLEVQASIPDEVPENVTMILMGDVQVENQGQASATSLDVTALANINIRLGPGTEFTRIGRFENGQIARADGRSEDSTWLRIQLPDGALGWVATEFVTLGGDLQTLPPIQLDRLLQPNFGPMQAFTFRTGSNDAPCESAPDSGLTIQTPEGVGEVRLLMNEVVVNVGSTITFQTVDEDDGVLGIVARVHEGRLIVNYEGEEEVIPERTETEIMLNLNTGRVSTRPTPRPYDNDETDNYQVVTEVMPRPVSFRETLEQEKIDKLNNYFDGTLDFDALPDDDLPWLWDYVVQDYNYAIPRGSMSDGDFRRMMSIHYNNAPDGDLSFSDFEEDELKFIGRFVFGGGTTPRV
ncbi:MAG: SH3 domain-containing protein [Anaerolineae bacterium]|nr:SH3 domain-containing protein [Anaerolineae bacterium]